MSVLPNVVVVMARCSHYKQAFGVRLEEKSPGKWIADWAFALKKGAGRREGYNQSEIKGIFEINAEYPGCPLCDAVSIFKCSCGKVACWDGERRTATCPWCGGEVELLGHVDSLCSHEDR